MMASSPDPLTFLIPERTTHGEKPCGDHLAIAGFPLTPNMYKHVDASLLTLPLTSVELSSLFFSASATRDSPSLRSRLCTARHRGSDLVTLGRRDIAGDVGLRQGDLLRDEQWRRH